MRYSAMKQKNHYEEAFCLWLCENGVKFSHVKQTERLKVDLASVKSFDFIIDTPRCSYIVELKGREFDGSSLENLRGLQNWVTSDDVQCMQAWQSAIENASGLFVFCYLLNDYFADTDGRDAIEYDGSKYAFIAITLDDYKTYMSLRSPKWRTVYLFAADFRVAAKNISDLFLEHRLSN